MPYRNLEFSPLLYEPEPRWNCSYLWMLLILVGTCTPFVRCMFRCKGRKGDHWARKWTGYRPYSLLLIAARDTDKQKVKLTFVPYTNARHNGHMEAKFRVWAFYTHTAWNIMNRLTILTRLWFIDSTCQSSQQFIVLFLSHEYSTARSCVPQSKLKLIFCLRAVISDFRVPVPPRSVCVTQS